MFKTLYRAYRILATGFSFAMFGFGGVFVSLAVLIFLYPLPIPMARKQAYTRWLISACCSLYIRLMRGLQILKFERRGRENFNENTRLIVANHPSLLDVVFLISMLRDSNCIIKPALWRNPFTFTTVRLAGYIRNDSSSVVDDAVASLRAGQRLIIFPAGTRNRSDLDLKFKRGAANIAMQAECPITPVLIKSQPRTLEKSVPWYVVPDRSPFYQIEVLPAFDPTTWVDPESPRTLQVRQLTSRLRDFYLEKLAKL